MQIDFPTNFNPKQCKHVFKKWLSSINIICIVCVYKPYISSPLWVDCLYSRPDDTFLVTYLKIHLKVSKRTRLGFSMTLLTTLTSCTRSGLPPSTHYVPYSISLWNSFISLLPSTKSRAWVMTQRCTHMLRLMHLKPFNYLLQGSLLRWIQLFNWLIPLYVHPKSSSNMTQILHL